LPSTEITNVKLQVSYSKLSYIHRDTAIVLELIE